MLCNCVDVMVFAAFSASELENKSIEAWPSSQDCVKLESCEMEPAKKEDKITDDLCVATRTFSVEIN